MFESIYTGARAGREWSPRKCACYCCYACWGFARASWSPGRSRILGELRRSPPVTPTTRGHSNNRCHIHATITHRVVDNDGIHLSCQVDHFDFQNNKTFNHRYLINEAWWDKTGGPIFFYTGNEGDITWFCNNTVSASVSVCVHAG